MDNIIPDQQTQMTPDEIPPRDTQDDISAALLANANNIKEQQIRADASAMVLGRILGSMIGDMQNMAGEIAVLKSREE